MQHYAEGTPVWMFYRLSRQPEGRRFLACPDRQAGIFRPRVGVAEGWIPGEVRADFDPTALDPGDPRTWVAVRCRWPHLYDRRGALADPGGDEHRLLPHHVAPRSGADDRLVRPAPAPELGLVVVRWGGRPVVSAAEWGSTGSSASDTYVAAFLELGLVRGLNLDGRYEVWTAYVEDATDLDALASSAHLIAALPFGGVVLAIFCLASLVFLATTYDSAAYSLASGASTALDPDQEPARWHRLFWAFALALLPLALMRIGGLDPMRTASLVTSLSLAALYVVMAVSLVRTLATDRRTQANRR